MYDLLSAVNQPSILLNLNQPEDQQLPKQSYDRNVGINTSFAHCLYATDKAWHP